ncbi:hypothetical protein POM88_045202 [Heracleum sosnowskyi]|uniref:Uncharacterized protein n=1 Tax=Heracleum sosnowskyi TaxID=360622 RepID=A0AAD8H608_9APIA|nr:hypothetical protein POM88_045202 [Heracleum sosnowskyi]
MGSWSLEFWAYEYLVFKSGLLHNSKPETPIMSMRFAVYLMSKDTETVMLFSICSAVNDDDDEVNLTFAWEIVRKKLLDSLNIIENKGNVGNGVTESGQQRPASLFAIAEDPRFRLLLASFHRLKKEAGIVSNVLGNPSTLVMVEPKVEFSQIIQKSCEHLCIDWLAEELSLKSSNTDMARLSILGEKLNVYDSVIQSIEILGKKDLYADLIGILRCGRTAVTTLISLPGVSVLEDLVISLADGVASMYVELISVDGNMSDGINSLGLSLCTLSTRALQRLQNEVEPNTEI